MKKIISLTVAILFLVNNLSYALNVQPGSINPTVRKEMYAGAGELWRAKVGPGGTWLDRMLSKWHGHHFIGEKPELKGIKFNSDPKYYPVKWKLHNPILLKKDLIEALECFRDNEAKIPSELLEIKEGYYELEKEKQGELPLARIEEYQYGLETRHRIIVHTKLVQMWNHIRENDVWFDYTFEDGETRTISLAWGIFYRIAKHEMEDLWKGETLSVAVYKISKQGEIKKQDDVPKDGGHIGWDVYKNKKRIQVTFNEVLANQIGGRYSTINDTMWLWFLQSYCFYDSTRYNNHTFHSRLMEIFSSNMRMEGPNFLNEFPNLSKDFSPKSEKDLFCRKLALAVNYHFFSRKGVKVPKLTVDPKLIEEYKDREYLIVGKPMYAGGKNEPDSLKEEYRETIEKDVKEAIKDGQVVKISPETQSYNAIREKERIINAIVTKVKEQYDISEKMAKNYHAILDLESLATVKQTAEKVEEHFLNFANKRLARAQSARSDAISARDSFLKLKFNYTTGELDEKWKAINDKHKEKIEKTIALVKAASALIESIKFNMLSPEEITEGITKAAKGYAERIINLLKAAQAEVQVAKEIAKGKTPKVNIIFDHTVPLYKDEGPGAVGPFTEEKCQRVWQGVNSSREQNIEIFIPQSVKLTSDMGKKLIEVKQSMKKIGKVLLWERYGVMEEKSRDKFFKTLKNNKENTKRIVITDDETVPLLYALIDTQDDMAGLFRDVKMINVCLPGSLDEAQKTQWQMDLFMKAILARVLEPGDKYFNDIYILLTDMLEGCFSPAISAKDFVDMLAVKEDEHTSIKKVRNRIKYFLLDTPSISLIEKLEVEWEAIKEFYKYL